MSRFSIIAILSFLPLFGFTVNEPDSLAVINIEVGDIAPDLAYPNPEGDTIRLSSLRGKVVLLDFWASWCGPCRRENPGLLECYETFKDKSFDTGEGFTIYSVGCEMSKSDWIRAIEVDHMIWGNHVSDLKGWEAEATYIYNISSIPANFLLDKDGRVIAENLNAEELEEKLHSMLKE